MASHKPLNEQVMVITGASSGIGLATALLAARYGARLVLVARSGETLKMLAARIEASDTSLPTLMSAPLLRLR